jgi:glycosyltransferase involved in cell wall biosynthesis
MAPRSIEASVTESLPLCGAEAIDKDPAPGNRSLPLLSIIVPVYNEARTVGEVLRRVQSVAVPKEIIFVDDGSTDGTRDILALCADEPEVRVIYHTRNQGKGAALATAFRAVKGDLVIIQDADLEYDPADYIRLLDPLLTGEADVVFGSRFLESQFVPKMALSHFLANWLLTRFSNLFTALRLTDMETGYKLFRKEVLAKISPTLRQQRFGIEPELTAKVARCRCRVKEIPIRYSPRTRAEGKKIRWRDGIKAVWCILRYAYWD